MQMTRELVEQHNEREQSLGRSLPRHEFAGRGGIDQIRESRADFSVLLCIASEPTLLVLRDRLSVFIIRSEPVIENGSDGTLRNLCSHVLGLDPHGKGMAPA